MPKANPHPDQALNCPHAASSAVGSSPTGSSSDAGADAGVPGPRPWPILTWRFNVARLFLDPLAYLARLRRRYGKVACLVQGGNGPLILKPGAELSSTVFGFGPECNRQVLSQPNVFESDAMRAPKECPWLGEAMFAANRKDRSHQRRLTLTGLDREHLREYYADVVDFANAMLEGWTPDQEICLDREMKRLAVNFASKVYFGQEPDEGHQTFAAISRDVTGALVSPVSLVPIRVPGSPYMKFLRLTKKAEDSMFEEISRRRTSDWNGKDAFSMMLKASDDSDTPLSDLELMGNAFALFVAGHDVPANALAFTLYLLAQHPEVSAELADELDRELGGGPPTFEQVWRLPVLDRVFRESLRVLSPGVMVWRRLTSDAVLGSYQVPAGCEVIISPYMTHVDPEVFPRPQEFLPGRWLEIDPSPYEYLPFSHGARKCLGAAFAEMLLKLVTAMVAQRYRLEVVPQARIDLRVTFILNFKNGLPMVVRRQDREFHRSKAPIRGQLRDLVQVS